MDSSCKINNDVATSSVMSEVGMEPPKLLLLSTLIFCLAFRSAPLLVGQKHGEVLISSRVYRRK